MASYHSLVSLSTWCSVLLVLVIQPELAYSSTRGAFSKLNGFNAIVASPDIVGVCASSVTVHGYKCQEFEVETQDGYILSVQRIPEGRGAGRGGVNKQPVLIQHGVMVDGTTWFLNPPEENLPCILAENGFDVWIANTRGTRFSRRHRSLDPNKPEFWNWSWDELVTNDLPAVFDFIHRQTGQTIDYVGHSLGTLIALASFSEGKLVDKLRSAALLSPIAYLSHMNTALGVVAAKSFVGEITTLFGLSEFNPKGEAVALFLKALCAYPGVDCYDLMSALTGMVLNPLHLISSVIYRRILVYFHSWNRMVCLLILPKGKNCCLNASTVELFLKNEPQSTSTKNMVHLAQTVRDGVLTKYNYGADFNVMHYGESTPPIYNLSNIPHDLPIFLSYGGQDALSDMRDVANLLDNLKFHDGNKLTVQFIKDYAHADFIMGVNAKDIVYNALVSFFKRQ